MRFLQREGEGTFKQTFRVVDAHGLSLALKLNKFTATSKRERREVDAMLRCNHKNIAKLLSVERQVFEGQKYLVIVEEFLSGGTLTVKGRLSVTQCLGIGKQLIDAVGHIAGLGLVHRDIKPDNIIFREDGVTPVLSDFGVVRDLADSSITPTWAPHGPGTPFFSSPEQLNNQKELIDWRSDQFSLGVVLAFVTMGEHPFKPLGGTDSEAVERVSLRQGPAPSFLSAAELAGLTALKRMVAPWPINRFRRPRQLAEGWNWQKGAK